MKIKWINQGKLTSSIIQDVEVTDPTLLLSEDSPSTTMSSDLTVKNDGTYTDNEWWIVLMKTQIAVDKIRVYAE